MEPTEPPERYVETIYDPDAGRVRLSWSGRRKEPKSEKRRAVTDFAWIIVAGWLVAVAFGIAAGVN